MRILHVIHTYPPFSRAGSENYAEALARAQIASGHDAWVFHRVDQPERPEYEVSRGRVAGVGVIRLNHTFREWTGFEVTYQCESVAEAFGAALDRLRPDVVHFHHTTTLSATCPREAKKRGLGVLFTIHDFWYLCPRGQLLRRDLTLCDRHEDADCVRCMAYQLPVRGGAERVRKLWRRAELLQRLGLPANVHRRLASRPFARETAALRDIRHRNEAFRQMFRWVDHFIAPSRFLAEKYVESGVPADRITVADYGFDLEPWKTDGGSARPRPPGPLRVAYLGTWIPPKGVHVLVEAFRGIEPEDAVVDIHGYAPPYEGFDDYEDHLRRLAGGAPQIRFRGRYEPTEVPKLLAEADVLVVPSIWYENSPLTVHEAYLAGVPVVASAHGGLGGLVEHEVSGLTFRPASPGSLRRAILRLAKDAALLGRLRQELPRVRSIEEDAAELDATYRSLIARPDESAGRAETSASEAAVGGRASAVSRVSVVIPTLNEADNLRQLLPRLADQVGVTTEVIVVDSGSTDDTVAVARAGGAQIVEIPPEEFSHSASRNLGGQRASHDLVVFMTADALPSSSSWLAEMIAAREALEVTAVSCREVPRADSDLFTRIQLWRHYGSFLGLVFQDRVLSMPLDPDPMTLRRSAQLSNVACLLPLEIHRSYPFRYEYAEDLDLGVRLIRDGHRLGLVRSPAVVHSHNRPPYYHLKRAYLEKLVLARILDAPLLSPPPEIAGVAAEIAAAFGRLTTFSLVEELGDRRRVSVTEVRRSLVDRAEPGAGERDSGAVEARSAGFLDGEFRSFLEGIRERGPKPNGSSRVISNAVLEFLHLALDYLSEGSPWVDARILAGLEDAKYKQFANLCGAFLANCYGGGEGSPPGFESLHAELADGRIVWEGK